MLNLSRLVRLISVAAFLMTAMFVTNASAERTFTDGESIAKGKCKARVVHVPTTREGGLCHVYYDAQTMNVQCPNMKTGSNPGTNDDGDKTCTVQSMVISTGESEDGVYIDDTVEEAEEEPTQFTPIAAR